MIAMRSENGRRAMLHPAQGIGAGMITKDEAGATGRHQMQHRLTLAVDERPLDHAATLIIIDGPMFRGSGKPRGLRTSKRLTICPHRSYSALTHAKPLRSSRCARCFGIPEMPSPPLTDTAVETGRSSTDCPVPELYRTSADSRVDVHGGSESLAHRIGRLAKA